MNSLSMGPQMPTSQLFISTQVSSPNRLSSLSNIYFICFPTDYVRSSILKNPNPLTFNITIPAKVPPKVPPGIRNPKTFLEVGQYLHALLVAEMTHGCDPFLAEWKDKPKAFGKAYQMQFIAYAQGAYPFTTPLMAGQTPLQWWMAFEGTEHGGILAVSSFKLGYNLFWMVLIVTFKGHCHKALWGSSTLDG